MTNLKDAALALLFVLMLTIAGYYLYDFDHTKTYNAGYKAGQDAIRPTSTKVETVKTTIYVPKYSKPVSKPINVKDTTVVKELIAELQNNNDSLQRFIVDRLSPKTFLVGDSLGRGYALVNYDPITDEYDGKMEFATVNTDSNFVKELPCKESSEPWYEDASMYAAGGATGILVIASGGTVLLGLGVTVGIGAVIAIF